jgi:hypothetical protein
MAMPNALLFVIFLLAAAIVGIASAQDTVNTTNTGDNNITAGDDSSSEPFLRYELPSFSLTLKVDKHDNTLITFQDRLEETIEDHLEDFFQEKLETFLKLPTKVRFDLESKLIWRELSTEASEASSQSQQSDYVFQEQELVKKYEVRGQYDSQMTLNYYNNNNNETVSQNSMVTHSLLTLLFIESFQGRNYWDLIHRILSSPTLMDTTDVQITVLEDGFVPNNGGAVAFDDDYWFATQKRHHSAMSPGMIVALAFVTFFCLAIVAIWTYLCYNVPSSFFMNVSKPRNATTYKGQDGSVTDDACTDNSLEYGDEETIGGSVGNDWMDVWAKQVTSIPIREPFTLPKRKKRGQPTRQSFVRPAHEHFSDLDCITELDNESCCNSTVASAKTAATSRTSRSSRSNRTTACITTAALVPSSANQSTDSKRRSKRSQRHSSTIVSIDESEAA